MTIRQDEHTSHDPSPSDDEHEPGNHQSKREPSDGHADASHEKQPLSEKPEDPRKVRRRHWIIAIVIIVLIAAGLIFGIPWYLHARQFESTDDAFIDAHAQRVAPQVAGRVLKVLVDDNQLVQAGQTLVQIDPSDVDVSLDQDKAMLAQAKGKLAEAQAQQLVAQAMVGQSEADVQQAQTILQNNQSELKRYEGLSAEAMSRQHLDDLRTAVSNQQAQVLAQQKKLSAAKAQVELAKSQITSAQASVQAAEAEVASAQLQISYATVKAAVAGRVVQKHVQVGDYLTVGQQLLIIVPHEVWVTANFKETELADMRPGQDVQIKVDALPDHKFHGKVASIQQGSGAWFSLLPPENATGNYVKVVQRVPVKIEFNDQDKQSDAYKMLGPGMSVDPSVKVR